MASKPATLIDRAVLWTTRLLGIAAAMLLFAMMVLTFVDVWGRYLFSSPVPGGFELTELMMAALIFAGLPLVTADREHVSVDLLDVFIPPLIARLRGVLIGFVCAGMMAILSYRMWFKAAEQVDYGDQTAVLHLPVAPVTFFMCAMTAATALVLLIHALGQAARHPR